MAESLKKYGNKKGIKLCNSEQEERERTSLKIQVSLVICYKPTLKTNYKLILKIF
jgi:hypothetical protein